MSSRHLDNGTAQTMGDIAIRASGVGKLYRIGTRESYKTFRDALTNRGIDTCPPTPQEGCEASGTWYALLGSQGRLL